MRLVPWLVVSFFLAQAPAALAASVKVDIRGGRMDIIATSAPIADILNYVAKKTGMKVIYNGEPPKKVLTKAVKDRTPAEALLAILEGEGINFAVVLNAAGTQVETLLVTKASPRRPSIAAVVDAGAPPIPEFDVEPDEPPPPPAPIAESGEGAPPAPPGQSSQGGATEKPWALLPTPTTPPASPFTPQGPGPVILPIPGATPIPQ